MPQTNHLQKKGFQLCSRCPLSEEQSEVTHIFLHCKVTSQLWNFFLSIFGTSWTMPNSITEMLKCWTREGLCRKAQKTWKTIPQVIWWSVWLEGNTKIIQGHRKKTYRALELRCLLLISFWCKLAFNPEFRNNSLSAQLVQ